VTSEITSLLNVDLFTIRGVRLVKLTMCWNIVLLSELTTGEKFGFFGAIWQ